MKHLLFISTLVLAAHMLPAQPVPGERVPVEQAPEQKFALVIGISGYPNYPVGRKLEYADDDAKLFAKTLQRPECGGFPAANIIPLLNRNATKDSILAAIETLKNLTFETHASNIIYFFFAGHGEKGNGNEVYLMPYDAKASMPASGGIEASWLIGHLREELSYKHLICFVDACHTGTVIFKKLVHADDEKGTDREPLRACVGNSVPTEFGLASCSNAQESYEDRDLKHGLFTWYLIKAMEGDAETAPGGSSDGRITVGEASNFILESVRARSALKFGQQWPCESGTNIDFVLSCTDKPPRPQPNPQPATSGGNRIAAAAALQEGRTLYADGNIDAAIEKYYEAIKLNPGFDTARYNLGVALAAAGDTEKAVQSFRMVTAESPQYAHAHLGLGVMLLNLRNADEAAVELMKATSLAPKEIGGYYYLAEAQALCGDLEGAVATMEQSITLSGGAPLPDRMRNKVERWQRAAAYLHEGRRLAADEEFDDALHEFYNVLRLDSGCAIAYHEIGRVHYLNDAFIRARENLAYAVQLNARDATARYLLAGAYEKLGKLQEAREQYLTCLELEPGEQLIQLVRERLRVLEHP